MKKTPEKRDDRAKNSFRKKLQNYLSSLHHKEGKTPKNTQTQKCETTIPTTINPSVSNTEKNKFKAEKIARPLQLINSSNKL